MEIRTLSPEDVEALVAVERRSFSVPWSRDLFYQQVGNLNAVFLLGFVEGRLIGYVGMQYLLDVGDIVKVAIDPDWRGRGYAKQLLQAMVAEAQQLGLSSLLLEVRKSNQSAIHIYGGQGFEVIGLRKKYYTQPVEDGLVMCKTLSPVF